MSAGGGLAVGGLAEGFEAGNRGLHGGGIEEGSGVFSDPCEQAMVEDVAGHRGFEFGPTDEEDEGMKLVFGDAEKPGEDFHMEVVLMERILEAVFGSIDLLGPLTLLFRTEDPAFVVFRLDDEDAEGGDDDMIELGGALAVGAG